MDNSKLDFNSIFEQLNALYEEAEVNEATTHAGEDPFPSMGNPFYIARLYHDYVDPSEMRWKRQLTSPGMSKNSIVTLDRSYHKINDPAHARSYLQHLIDDGFFNKKVQGSEVCGIDGSELRGMVDELLEVL